MHTDYTISSEEFAAIEKYLLGEATAVEKLAFENKLATDASWILKVNEIKLLLSGIEKASLKARLNSYHSRIAKNKSQKAAGKVISLSRKWLVAASVVLLAASSVWFFTFKTNKFEKLYASYYKPDPGLMSAMGVGDNYLFNRAMLDYKTGDYKKAIKAWSKLSTGIRPNDTLNYFLGAAQQADGNSAAALALLQRMAADVANPFYKDACWYIGLALLKQGAAKEAIPYLEKSGRPESIKLISQLK